MDYLQFKLFISMLLLTPILSLSALLDQENQTEYPIIPKCCPANQSLLHPSKGCTSFVADFDPPFADERPSDVDLVYGLKCQYGKYRLEPEIASEDEFHLLADGSLSVPFQQPSMFTFMEYCLEYTMVDEQVRILPFLCLPAPTDTTQSWRKLSHIIFPIGCLTSIPLLLIVVLLYLGISELRRTVHAKVLACYSICLSFAYFFLSMVQLFGDQLEHTPCVVLAFVIQFSFMASFFWLNLLCLHIWRQLNKGCSMRGDSIRDRLLFVLYSLYGWGLPILFITVSVVMDLAPAIPSSYLKPNFGLNSCWFHSDNAMLPYFYGPIAVLLIINVIFFFLSARIIHKTGPTLVERITTLEQAVKTVIVHKRRQSFVQAILLFLAMGLNWLLEVVSWFVGGPPPIWFFTDIINTLQGVFVFYIYVIRDPWVRRLALQYFMQICCCQKNSGVTVPEEDEEEQVHHINNIIENGSNKKKFFQMVPLVVKKEHEQKESVG